MSNEETIPVSNVQKSSSDFPTEFIDLPSEGYFYPIGSPLSSGRIELKYMTAKEEDILTSQNLIKKGIVLDELLKALIVTPGVKLDDLLIGDKNAIFVAARRLAYGDKYEASKVACPKCGHEQDITINLAELSNKEFDFTKYTKGENKFTFQLPTTKKNVVYKLLTHKDEQEIDSELKGLAKVSKGGSSPEMTTRLKYMIVSVDGNSDRGEIKKFVDNMPSRDSVAFRKVVRDNSPDLDMTFNFKCSECGHEERMALPLGVDFFWPKS
jgi:DNA-directed RNA polymerase subunit M/transcription elongation factor TFIIS